MYLLLLSFCKDDEDNGGDGGGDDAPHPDASEAAEKPSKGAEVDSGSDLLNELDKERKDVALVAHWINDCVPISSFATLPTPGDDSPIRVIQFLNLQERIKLLPSFRGRDPHARVWNVQAFGVHRADLITASSTILDVFPIHVPFVFDFMAFLSKFKSPRSAFKLWETATSDLGGLTALVSPRELVPTSPLSSPRVPILALCDTLDTSHIGVERRVTHAPRSGKFYDCRFASLKRGYLQAVLADQKLWEKGCTQFQSGMAECYYLALVKSPATVVPNQKAEVYKNMIKGVEGESALLALPAPTVASKRALALTDGIDGDDGQPPLKKSLALKDVDVTVDGDEGDAKPPSSSSSDSDSSDSKKSSVDGDGSSSSGSGSSWDVRIPKFIEGMLVLMESHGDDPGIRVGCKFHGAGCRKYRSLSRCDRYGERSAHFFLGAWMLKGADLPKSEHKKKSCKPTDAEIKAYIKSQADFVKQL